jgi:hypothetical protein
MSHKSNITPIDVQKAREIEHDNEWYCTSCRRIFITKNPKCCGEVVKFEVAKHGRSLIGLSNAWIQVWKKWENHPMIQQVSREWAEDNNFGAAGILNDAFTRIQSTLDALVNKNQDLRREKLLIHVTHPHSGETWDYRITPSEIDDTGITIECGAFDEQRYLIKITKEPTNER